MCDLSIITVNYNNLAGLKKTTQSVFSQDFSGYEYIVIDGESTDGSGDYLNEIKDRLSYSVSEPDNGVYDAMNKGIAKAKGKFLVFLNSGDFLIDTSILSKVSTYIKSATSDIYYGNIRITDGAGNESVLKFPAELSLRFWKAATINHQASIIKADLFREIGVYDRSFSLAADYAFFLKCFFLGKHFEADQ